MRSRSALVFGLVALAAFTGCANRTRTVVIESDASVGQASPATLGSEVPRCDGGTYNAAAGMCVSEGGGGE